MDDRPIRLDRVCRGCLGEDAPMRPLFPDRELGLMLLSSTQLRVSEDDGLPCQICIQCTNQLSSAFSFKKMCERSDEKLRLYISKSKDVAASSLLCRTSDQATIKEEGSTQIPAKSDLIDFNSMFNNEISSGIKIESDSVGVNTEADKKISFCVPNLSQTPLIIMNSNEKWTQTKWADSFEKIYGCSECTKKFTSHVGLSNHLKWRHGMKNVVTCPDCDKIFMEPSELSEHSKIHESAAKVSDLLNCQMCEKTFVHQSNLKRHMWVHGKKKIFNCTGCDHGFNKLENYKKHKVRCEGANTSTKSSEKDCDASSNNFDGVKDRLLPEAIKIDYDAAMDVDVKVKDEPLEDLLEEAEREQMMDDESNSIDDNNSNYDGIGSDSSECLENIKPKKKLGRPFKNKIKLRTNSSSRKHTIDYKIHGDKYMYNCEECSESFSKMSDLKKHETTHIDSESKKVQCPTCHKEFTRKENLLKHMWQHMEEKPFNCDLCPKGFIRKEQLDKHKMALHSDKKKNPKTAFCKICNRGFTTEKYLETHMRMHTGDKSFTCPVCGKSFNTKWHLKEHSKWHSPEKPFLCSECGQRFIRNDYLITHMRRHKGEKPYKCKFCNKGFPRATDLTVHERYHTGEKTHLCTICGKGFQRQYNLNVHLRVHTGEKPYVCSYCGRRFAQGNDLKSHVRRHTGERFHCEFCGEGFIQGYHLTQHKRSAHGLQCDSRISRVEKHVQANQSGKRDVPKKLEVQLEATITEHIEPEAGNTPEVIISLAAQSCQSDAIILPEGKSINIPEQTLQIDL